MVGGEVTVAAQPAYTEGTAAPSSSTSAYLSGQSTLTDTQPAYLAGVVRSSQQAFLSGIGLLQINYYLEGEFSIEYNLSGSFINEQALEGEFDPILTPLTGSM
jgi:hypothetical protein